MPFTLAHPSIVLLLKKVSPQYLSMTALIIGSMLPDFEYFFRMKIMSSFSHEPLGVIFFDLPLGLILTFLFHNTVKQPLIDNLPQNLRIRFQAIKNSNWNAYFKKHYIVVIYSLLLGIMSHIFWDSFTHPCAYFVQKIPFLTQKIGTIYIYKLLQHGSTLLGFTFIAYVIYKLPKQIEVSTQYISQNYWLIFTTITFATIFLRMILSYTTQIGTLIVSMISACMISLIITSCLFIYHKHRKEQG